MSDSINDQRELVRTLDHKFGARMRRERERQKMGQGHLATIMGVTYGITWYQTTVGKVESGERPIKLAEAVAVSLVLGVPLTELLFDDVDNTAKRERVMRAFYEVAEVRRFVDTRLDSLREEAAALSEGTRDGEADGGQHPEAS